MKKHIGLTDKLTGNAVLLSHRNALADMDSMRAETAHKDLEEKAKRRKMIAKMRKRKQESMIVADNSDY